MAAGFEADGAPLQLGDAVNLLHGVARLPLGPGLALQRAPRAPLRAFALDAGSGSGWAAPCVTLHQDLASLLERLFAHRVGGLRHDRPRDALRPMRLRAPDDGERTRALAATLGAALVEGRSYLLFELRRSDGRAEHEVSRPPARRFFDRARHLGDEWRVAASRLRPGMALRDGSEHDAIITAPMAQAYLDSFYRFGTHFVSAVELGDAWFQLIALRPESAPAAWRYWRQLGDGAPVEGAQALAFRQFASRAHALEAGPPVSLANDPALALLLASGAWADPDCAAGHCMLAGFGANGAPRQVLAAGALSVPTCVELTPLSRFMEFYRARNFERVLRGALLQRWGADAGLPLPRRPGFDRAIGAAPGDPACCRVASMRGPGRAPLLAQLLDAADDGRDAAVVVVPDELFGHGDIVCATMSGALILQNAAGTERHVVVDGLRFADTGAGLVRVAGDLHALPAACLAASLPQLRAALEQAAAVLFLPGAAAFASWVASLLPANSPDPAVRTTRVFALYLANAECALPCEDRLDGAAVDVHLAAIAAAAIDAGRHLRGHAAARRDSDAPAQLEALGRRATQHYLALLDVAAPRRHAARQQANRSHMAASAALLGAARQWRQAGTQSSQTAGLALDIIVAAAEQRNGPDAGVQESQAVLEFAGAESQQRRCAARLDNLGRLAALVADDPAAFDQAESALMAIDAACAAPADVGGAALRPLLAGAAGDDDALLGAWDRFVASRRALAAAASACHRIALERWHHGFLAPAMRAIDAVDAGQHIAVERVRLLATLGQAVRRAAVAPDELPLDHLEPDSIGYLLAARLGAQAMGASA
jgi:hypothetical protein